MMTQEYKEAVLKIWELHQYVKPEFSCTLCRAKVNPPTCQGCPIYPHQPFSVIKWQTGKPIRKGRYILSIKGGKIDIDNWSIYTKNWYHYNNTYVLAWCKLSDIEPYKE